MAPLPGGLGGIVLGLLAVFGLAVLGLMAYIKHEARLAAEAVEDLTGPDVVVVDDELPDAEALASGAVDGETVSLPDEDTPVADGGAVVSETDRQIRSVADSVQLEPAMPTDSAMGLIASWRHRQKAKKLARKGYVKWYKVGPQMQQPQWVKPFRNGQGELVYYDDGAPYLFTEEAMTTDARTGAHVCVHEVGDALPIDLNDPAREGLDTDKFQETIDLAVESDAPGFWDRLEIDGQTMLYGAMALMLVLAGAAQFFGGGL